MADVRLTTTEIRALLRAIETHRIDLVQSDQRVPKPLLAAYNSLRQALQRTQRNKIIEMKLVRGKPRHGA